MRSSSNSDSTTFQRRFRTASMALISSNRRLNDRRHWEHWWWMSIHSTTPSGMSDSDLANLYSSSYISAACLESIGGHVLLHIRPNDKCSSRCSASSSSTRPFPSPSALRPLRTRTLCPDTRATRDLLPRTILRLCLQTLLRWVTRRIACFWQNR